MARLVSLVRSTEDGRVVTTLIVAVAVVLQLVVAVPFTAASGLLAPLWGVVAAWMLWLVAAIALVLVARRRPLLAPVVPLVNVVLLWALITGGDLWLGWTA